MNKLQNFKDKISLSLYNMTVEEAIEKGICIDCKQPAHANCYSEAGFREFKISGLCEKCFDKICGEE